MLSPPPTHTYYFFFRIYIWGISLQSLTINRLISVHIFIYFGTQSTATMCRFIVSFHPGNSPALYLWIDLNPICWFPNTGQQLWSCWMESVNALTFLPFSCVCYYYLNLFLYDSIVVVFSIYLIMVQSCCFGPQFILFAIPLFISFCCFIISSNCSLY